MNQHGQRIILHISDLHRTPGKEALTNTNLWATLNRDISYGFRLTNRFLTSKEPRLPDLDQGDTIDIVVVSGDLTQRAATAEYGEVKDFLNLIVNELLNKETFRLVLVPGNHDVDWQCSRDAYQKVSNDPEYVKQAFDHDSKYRLDLADLTLRERKQQAIYNERFKPFSEFLSNFYKAQDQPNPRAEPESQKGESQRNVYDFPIDDPKKQFIIFDEFTKDLGIVVVGFNSCHHVDHLWHRGSIHTEAILEASQALEGRGHKEHAALRIAVWHHNILGSPQQSDFMDPRTAVLLAKFGFALGLHGHIHEAGRFDLLGSNARIPIVWAGSLCAGSSERPRAVPLQYNVIGIDPIKRSGWVHVRERKNEHEAWSSCNEWGDDKRPWYPLQLSLRAGQYEHSLAPPGNRFIGIDIGASKIACVLLDLIKTAGTPHVEHSLTPTPTNESKLFDKVTEIISQALSKGIGNESIDGIGIGLPGMVNPCTGHLLQAPNLDLRDIEFVDNLKFVIGRSAKSEVLAKVPIYIDNDVNCATRGYCHLKTAKRNFVCIFIGNGAGSGIVVDGKLVYGHTFSAGEVGHSTIDPKQYQEITGCSCGLNGHHWETFVSNRGMVKLAECLGKNEIHKASYEEFNKNFQDKKHKKDYREALSKQLDIEDNDRQDREGMIFSLRDAFHAGQKFAVAVVKEYLEFLAIGIANYMNILNPQEIVLGGGMIRGFFGNQLSKPLGMPPKSYLHGLIHKYAVPSVTSAHIEHMVVQTEEEKRNLASVGAALIFKDESYFQYIDLRCKLENRGSR